MKKISEIKHNILVISSLVLSGKRDKLKFLLVSVVQFTLALMDLIGVSVVGLIGALSISGVQSRAPGEGIEQLLRLLSLDNQSFQSQVAILGLSAALIFLLRTVFSIFLTRRILRFLGRRSAGISIELSRKLLSQGLLNIQKRSDQDYIFGLTTGVSNIALGVIGSLVLLVSDLILLIVLTVGLLLVNIGLALGTILFFVMVGWILYLYMEGRASALGKEEASLAIDTNQKILESINTYREAVVRNRRGHYVSEIGKSRSALTETLAELSFMPHVSKYIIESALVIGALLISATQFITQDSTQAIATLTVFLAAGTRIAPAILRIQQSAIQVNRSIGSATPTFDLINSMEVSDLVEESEIQPNFNHTGFTPEIELAGMSFRYPDSNSVAIENVNLTIRPGTVVAIVGPSGAGKTTLVDVLVGVLKPTEGAIKISGVDPAVAFSKWSGAIGYVPQKTFLSNGTISSNIALGYSNPEKYNVEIYDAIKTAQLDEMVQSLPMKELFHVGDGGSKLSGGQIQRIGIARAIFTKPKLLILDEATSALDGETEANISEAIQNLKGDVTIVLIAHRLSTVREADQIVYIEKGKIVATGNFEQVRSSVPNFDKQASLMGL
jgi:ABC-type multidrug transport system fused ATPase/permease subunit